MKIFAGMRKEVVILIVIITVNLIVFYCIGIFFPAWKNFTALSDKEKLLCAQIKKASTVAQDKSQIEEEVKAIRKKIDFYEKLLPRSTETSQILAEVVKMGAASSVTIVSVEPQPVEKYKIPEVEKYYIEIPIKMSLKAGYHELARFFNMIETAGRFMKVENIYIVGDTSDIKRHKVTLMLVAFAQEG